MAKDFAKTSEKYIKGPTASKKNSKTKDSTLSRKLLILFFTLSIIITCCIIIYIQNGMTYKLEVVKKNNETVIKPKFEFYKILPNMQVKLVDDKKIDNKTQEQQIVKKSEPESIGSTIKIEDLNPQKVSNKSYVAMKLEKDINTEKKTQAIKKLNSKKVNYVLQLASFKDYKDADNLRAKMLLSGIDVEVYSARLQNDKVWYRVRSKKSNNYQDITNLKNKLLAFKIKAIILKEIS